MKKILIVDDEKMMLKMATRILAKNYKIVGASSGAEAIELFKAERPDMVLSDLLMPEMDGYTLHRELQALSEEPVPIMFMTADESDEAESRGFEIGAADYIRKPLKPDVLLRRVGNIIDNLDKIIGLRRAVDVDPMTGLLNKAAAQRELTKLCSSATGVLMMIDLDSFKLVNDLYGHNMGDQILIKFSELLKNVIRSSDTAGRMGGDEFMAFCQNVVDEKIIKEKTARLNDELLSAAKNLMGADMNISLGVSIGAVFVPDEGTDFASLCRKADKALYTVKQNGKHGCAFWHEDHHVEKKSARSLTGLQMIFGERNKTSGAYVVEFEQFKLMYRWAARLVDDGRKSMQFMQITLSDAALAEEFLEALTSELRRSDCVTQHGRNQILVLLTGATADDAEKIRGRIENNWASRCGLEIESTAVE